MNVRDTSHSLFTLPVYYLLTLKSKYREMAILNNMSEMKVYAYLLLYEGCVKS